MEKHLFVYVNKELSDYLREMRNCKHVQPIKHKIIKTKGGSQ